MSVSAAENAFAEQGDTMPPEPDLTKIPQPWEWFGALGAALALGLGWVRASFKGSGGGNSQKIVDAIREEADCTRDTLRAEGLLTRDEINTSMSGIHGRLNEIDRGVARLEGRR